MSGTDDLKSKAADQLLKSIAESAEGEGVPSNLESLSRAYALVAEARGGHGDSKKSNRGSVVL